MIPRLGRSSGEGNGNPLQYFCLENSMDGRTWCATVHGVAKSRTRLSDFTFTTISIFIYMLLNTYIVLDLSVVYKAAISSVLIIMLLCGHTLSFSWVNT